MSHEKRAYYLQGPMVKTYNKLIKGMLASHNVSLRKEKCKYYHAFRRTHSSLSDTCVMVDVQQY